MSGLQIERKVDVSALVWPDREGLEYERESDGFGGNRRYISLRGMRWSEAAACLSFERSIVSDLWGEALLDRIEEYERERDDDEYYDDPYHLDGLDLGVASTAFALAAARCIPITSCNGGRGHQLDFASVVSYVKPKRALDLIEVAAKADCGLLSTSEGLLEVYSGDVHGTMVFAEELIKRKSSLRPLRQARRPAQKDHEAAQVRLRRD